MKRIIVFLVVLALTFAVVLPAAANGNGSGGGNGGGNGGENGGNGGGNGTGPGPVTSSGNGEQQQGPNGLPPAPGGSGEMQQEPSDRAPVPFSVPQRMQQGPRGVFSISGTITALGSDTVTINVFAGNKLVHEIIGGDLTISVTTSTRYLYHDETTTSAITFADLQVGQPVNAYGIVAGDTWTASRITVGAQLIHQ